ncbi:hypothetical protein [Desulfopila sp. IMCC35008]|uniref:hypothetical protein n=1 Tax=Desulfopila sp. IMCC35008 TaxID=2653858 RepID=UPI0013D2C9F4|nr:hypothetical protein [Desulfopila sp. IMCC35008]
MKNLLISLTIVFLSLTIFCALAPAQKTQSGKDSEVAATYFKVVDLILTGQSRKLEKLMDDIANSKAITDDGKRRLEEMYKELLRIDEALLDRWVSSSPNSAHPYIVRGKYYLMQAERTIQKDSQKSTPSQDAALQLLQKAQADFEKANKLNPANPASAAAMVAVSMYRGYDKQEMEQWFIKATGTDPFWLDSYRNKLHYLSPSRQGSDAAILDFALKCAASSPAGSSVYSILFDYFETLNPRQQDIETTGTIQLNLPDRATEAFLQTIKRFKADFPYSNIPYYYEARFRFLQSDEIPAEFILSKILREEPQNILALEARITLYMAWKKWPKAKKDIDRLLQISPNSLFAKANRDALNRQTQSN